MASQPIWPAAGQQGGAGPDLVRRDTCLTEGGPIRSCVSLNLVCTAAGRFAVSLKLVQDMRCLIQSGLLPTSPPLVELNLVWNAALQKGIDLLYRTYGVQRHSWLRHTCKPLLAWPAAAESYRPTAECGLLRNSPYSCSRCTSAGLPLGHSTARPQTSQTASSG